MYIVLYRIMISYCLQNFRWTYLSHLLPLQNVCQLKKSFLSGYCLVRVDYNVLRRLCEYVTNHVQAIHLRTIGLQFKLRSLLHLHCFHCLINQPCFCQLLLLWDLCSYWTGSGETNECDRFSAVLFHNFSFR